MNDISLVEDQGGKCGYKMPKHGLSWMPKSQHRSMSYEHACCEFSSRHSRINISACEATACRSIYPPTQSPTVCLPSVSPLIYSSNLNTHALSVSLSVYLGLPLSASLSLSLSLSNDTSMHVIPILGLALGCFSLPRILGFAAPSVCSKLSLI